MKHTADQAAQGHAKAVVSSGKYDPAARRQSARRGRERGCSVYIPADELAKTGIDMDAGPPLYRVWGSSRGRIVIQLYKQQHAKG